MLKSVFVEMLWGSHIETGKFHGIPYGLINVFISAIIMTTVTQLLANAEMGVDQHLWLSQTWCFPYDLYIVVICSSAGNKTTHLNLYLLLSYESSATVAEILKGQICVIMNHTLTFNHVMKAHQINYPVITAKWALLSCDNKMIILWSVNNKM